MQVGGLPKICSLLPRRSRRLELWQLIAGTLIHYPDYIHPETHQAINAETAAQILIRQKICKKQTTDYIAGTLLKIR